MQDNETDNKNISSDYSGIIEEGYQENKYDIEQYIQNIDTNEPKNNLIVNYLPSGMTETQLKELFQDYGQLESVKLMTDKNTKMSLGYGFVKFAHDEDAKKALESLNGKTLENKTLKVNIAKQNGKIKKSNLYIAYLSNQISDKFILRSQFEKFGKIMDTKLLSDERGNNKGVGFVRFENKEDAERAIQAMNGCMDPQICNGQHPLVVKFSDKDKRDKTKMLNKNPFRPPFLKNYAMFTGYRYSPYGGAYDRVPNPYPPPYPYPPETYMPPNFGYPNPTPYPNSLPPPNVNIPKNFLPMVPNSPDNSYCLFVYNLPPETDDTLLYRLFNPYGNISSVKVIKEPTTGQCKGYSFVNFYKYEEAYAAVNALNGFIYQNKKLQVSFKKQN